MSHFCSKTYFLFKGIYGYRRFMNITYDLSKYLDHPEVSEKLKIISFFDHYGLSTTKDAFNVGRSTIFLWKKKLKEGNGSLDGLINKKRKPYNVRRMYVDEKIYNFIKKIREEHLRLGKDKIKPLLDGFCQKEKITSISSSKIGKIIKKNDFFLYLGRRDKKKVYLDKKRVFGYEIKKPGDLFQIDTIVRFEHGIKRYILTAVDVSTRFAFALTYKGKTAKNTTDFVEKLLSVTPYPILGVQTDNGSEFLEVFDQKAREAGIVHFFTYPKNPKQNAFIERFNRTLQEEFVEENAVLLEEEATKAFNDKLIDYLLWYNTERPHSSLKNKPPMEIVVNYLKESNMYATHT